MNNGTAKEIYQDIIFKIKLNISQNTRIIRKDNQMHVYLYNLPLGVLKGY